MQRKKERNERRADGFHLKQSHMNVCNQKQNQQIIIIIILFSLCSGACLTSTSIIIIKKMNVYSAYFKDTHKFIYIMPTYPFRDPTLH